MTEKVIVDISSNTINTTNTTNTIKTISKDPSLCQYADCRKRIKITEFACKCEKLYCKMHKSPENHECTYDYREIGLKTKKIEEMKCVSNKMQKL